MRGLPPGFEQPQATGRLQHAPRRCQASRLQYDEPLAACGGGKTKTAHAPVDETQKRLTENFKIISSYFDGFFKSDSDPSGFDLPKLTYYITYLLDRVSIVEIRIERQDNVAMIF